MTKKYKAEFLLGYKQIARNREIQKEVSEWTKQSNKNIRQLIDIDRKHYGTDKADP